MIAVDWLPCCWLGLTCFPRLQPPSPPCGTKKCFRSSSSIEKLLDASPCQFPAVELWQNLVVVLFVDVVCWARLVNLVFQSFFEELETTNISLRYWFHLASQKIPSVISFWDSQSPTSGQKQNLATHYYELHDASPDSWMPVHKPFGQSFIP